MSEIKDPPVSKLDPELQSMLDMREAEDKSFIYCAACSSSITKVECKIEVNGSHTHYFTNPYNIQFHVGCFAQALGCDISGESQAADSWFMGFVWRLASCAECHNHLGWYFSQADNYFYGLILNRIQEDH